MPVQFTNTLVFALHGMGDYAEGWAKPFIDTLDRAIREHKYTALLQELGEDSVTQLIDFHPITYCETFSELIAAWAHNASDVLKEIQNPEDKVKIEKAVDWLEQAPGGAPHDSFVWTHLLDVFFWVTSSYLRAKVKNTVARALTTIVGERLSAPGYPRLRTSVVAHSLGTSVALQTLQDLASGAWGAAGNGWAPAYFRLDSYHAVANVSRLLDIDGEYSPYDGLVRPGPYGDPLSCILYFNNYRHLLDPFCLARTFDPPHWTPSRFDHPTLSHIYQTNVHALEHYALHPAVHIRLLRSWLGYGCITAEEEAAAYEKFSGNFAIADGQAGQKATEIANAARMFLGLQPDLVDILKAIAFIAPRMKGQQLAAANGGVHKKSKKAGTAK